MNGITASGREACNRTLLAALLATVLMLFTGFAAAYMERQTSGDTWDKNSFPPVMLVSTIVLAASSLALEWARRRGQERQSKWLGVALGLGLLFVVGQAVAFAQLRADGVFVATNAYASFFYLLTGLHALHVVAGLTALVYAMKKPSMLPVAAGFWHFMGGIWLYVLIVLAVL
ncbi:MAG: cytochrome c oxidase subunit 3 [Planctomycetota bacterium]|jgi:cytochrome c oxidase subunit 3